MSKPETTRRYKFDRYIGRHLMAEGGCVHAKSEDEARDLVGAMFAFGAAPGEMARTTFTLVSVKEPRTNMANEHYFY